MSKQFILAIDQGTTSSRAIIFDKKGNIKKIAQKEFTQIYPKSGWVEHDPMEIWASQSSIVREALEQVFIPFYTTKKTGSGIGLSLSRQIMQLHNGTLTVDSEVGKGTIFTLNF